MPSFLRRFWNFLTDQGEPLVPDPVEKALIRALSPVDRQLEGLSDRLRGLETRLSALGGHSFNSEPEDLPPRTGESQVFDFGSNLTEVSDRLSAIDEKLTRAERQGRRNQAALESLLEFQASLSQQLNQSNSSNSQLQALMDFGESAILFLNSFPQDLQARIVYNKFLTLLRAFELTSVGQRGEPFDPELHQACHVDCDPELGDNSIFDIVKPGFVSGDKVMRYATVIVNRLTLAVADRPDDAAEEEVIEEENEEEAEAEEEQNIDYGTKTEIEAELNQSDENIRLNEQSQKEGLGFEPGPDGPVAAVEAAGEQISPTKPEVSQPDQNITPKDITQNGTQATSQGDLAAQAADPAVSNSFRLEDCPNLDQVVDDCDGPGVFSFIPSSAFERQDFPVPTSELPDTAAEDPAEFFKLETDSAPAQFENHLVRPETLSFQISRPDSAATEPPELAAPSESVESAGLPSVPTTEDGYKL
jgi:hypothetical protein